MVQKASLRIVGVIGAVTFVTFFVLTFSTPGWIENFAQEFIKYEVAKQIDSRVDSIGPPAGDNALSKFASAVYKKNQVRIDGLKNSLKVEAHEKMADALAEIRNLDCECRAKWVKAYKESFKSNIALLEAANEKVVGFIQSTYMNVVEDLKRDIRIFTGSNAAVFVMLLLVSFLKPRAVAHLFLPGVLLVLATAICSYFYIFEQNWLLTVIHNDYLGFVYMGYIGLVFSFLCDIAFNRARVTTKILNAFFNAIGSAVSVVPC